MILIVVRLYLQVLVRSVGRLSKNLKNEYIQSNRLFQTKKDLISKLKLLAVKCHFEFKVEKSNKSTYTVVHIENELRVALAGNQDQRKS